MKKIVRLYFTVLTTVLLLAIFAASVSAQRNPTMTEQQRDVDKETLYAKFIEHKRIAQSNEQRLAYEAGKEYLRLFGTEKDLNVKEVRKFVTEYESVRRQYAIDAAFSSKNYPKTF